MLQTNITKFNDYEGVASNKYKDLKHSKNEIDIELKKTYGHKYYVAASIGFEEKSYPFIRKVK